MKGTIRATVKVTWRASDGTRRSIQRERRFVKGTPARVLKAWREATRAKLMKRQPAATDRTVTLGTLKADAPRYLAQVRHLNDWAGRRSLIRAWFPAFGDTARHAITREDVLRVRGEWKAAGAANRTINNRISALRDLYRKLDGDDAWTPCDGVKLLTPPRTPIQRVSAETINAVLDRLLEIGLHPPRGPGKGRGRPGCHALHDRARLMVLASTGRRPCEVERAKPEDVNLEVGVWGVRDAKGGWSRGLPLNSEMKIAWQTFVDVNAWGKFPEHFEIRLRTAGWPKGIRPYNVRHSTWITASERGADLSDIQEGAGHLHLSTTRQHYVPVLNSRIQKLTDLIDGRFGWAVGEDGCTGVAGTPIKPGA